MQTKVCKRCGKELPINNFTKSKNMKDGHENKCKKCRQEQKKNHKIICEYCGKEFLSAKKNTKFCSKECQGMARRNRVKTRCAFCGEEIEVVKSKYEKFEFLYCNQNCRTEHLKILMKGENNPNYSSVKYKCDGCGKDIDVMPYKLRTLKHIFCSYECYKKNIGKFYTGENNHAYVVKEYKCDYCGNEFKREPYKNRGKRVFCSRECYIKQNKERERKKEVLIKCPICGLEKKVWTSRLKYSKDIYCSYECARKGFSLKYSKENSPNYNPNLSDEERILRRHYPEYLEWRKQIFERDRYTCDCCGSDKGGDLNAHHLNSYDWDKKHRTDINNGVTLCETCHKEFHKIYGYGNNKKEQYIDFKSQYRGKLKD